MNDEQERREFTRVQVKLQAELQSGGKVLIQGELGDVSLNGLFLLTRGTLPIDSSCQIMLMLDGGQGMLCIQVKGKVSRVEESGIAIQFTEILGEESLSHLRNLVLLNSGDLAQQVEHEFHEHVGIKEKG